MADPGLDRAHHSHVQKTTIGMPLSQNAQRMSGRRARKAGGSGQIGNAGSR
jgi:hypothetical protein